MIKIVCKGILIRCLLIELYYIVWYNTSRFNFYIGEKLHEKFIDRLHYLEVIEDGFEMFYDKLTEENQLEIQQKLGRFVQSLNKTGFDYLYENLKYKEQEYIDKEGVRI